MMVILARKSMKAHAIFVCKTFYFFFNGKNNNNNNEIEKKTVNLLEFVYFTIIWWSIV